MKLKKALFLTAALSLTLCTSVSAYPARVWNLGEYINYTAPPFMSTDKSTLMVPMRTTLEYFGASADTNMETGLVVTSFPTTGTIVQMEIGSTQMIVNGTPQTLPAAPVIVDSQLFVPLRAIAASLHYGIGYDKNMNFVTAGVAVAKDAVNTLVETSADGLDMYNEYPSMQAIKDIYHIQSSVDGYLYELKGYQYDDIYRVVFNFRVVDGKVVKDYAIQTIDEPNLSKKITLLLDGSSYEVTLQDFFQAVEQLKSSYTDKELHYVFGDAFKEYDKYKGLHKEAVETVAQQYMKYMLPVQQ